MDKVRVQMKLIKCEHCGFYHFFLGHITLNLTEKQLWAIGDIINQVLIDVRESESNMSENMGQRKCGNLVN